MNTTTTNNRGERIYNKMIADKILFTIIIFLGSMVITSALLATGIIPQIFKSSETNLANQENLKKIKHDLLVHSENSHNLTNQLLLYDINLSKYQDKVLRNLNTVLTNHHDLVLSLRNITIVNQMIMDEMVRDNKEFRNKMVTTYMNQTNNKLDKITEKLNLTAVTTIMNNNNNRTDNK